MPKFELHWCFNGEDRDAISRHGSLRTALRRAEKLPIGDEWGVFIVGPYGERFDVRITPDGTALATLAPRPKATS